MTDTSNILLGCCSDTHGGISPTWHGLSIAGVLHAGDVYDAPTVVPDEDDPIPREWALSAGVPVLAVKGNHDYVDPGKFFRSVNDITGRLHQLDCGLWIGGIGMAPRHFYNVPGDAELEPLCLALSRQIRRSLGPGQKWILLTHYPPKLPELPCDEVPASWTCRCIADLVREHRPAAVVQGHLHEWFGRQWMSGGTLIVSPGPSGGILSVATDRGTAGFERLP